MKKIIELEKVFNQAVADLKESFEGLKAELISVDKPELIMHDGKQLKKVERETEEGDYVRFVKDFGDRTKADKFYEVVGDRNFIDDGGVTLGVYGWGGEKSVEGVYEVVHETVDRVARVGEFILITNADEEQIGISYGNGDVMTVTGLSGIGNGDVICGIFEYVKFEEYVVITKPEQSPVIKEEPEIIEHEGLMLRAVERNARTGDYVRFINVDSEFTKNGVLYEVFEGGVYKPHEEDSGYKQVTYRVSGWNEDTKYEVFENVKGLNDHPNQQRAELVEWSKRFVESKRENANDKSSYRVIDELGMPRHCSAYFVVNEEKRTVVVLMRGCHSRDIYAKGIAKCMPGEVFNKWIGMAIALSRALNIPVQEKLLNAVQPTEKVIGMVVEWDGRVRKIAEEAVFGKTCQLGSDTEHYSKIISDTNAIYEEESK